MKTSNSLWKPALLAAVFSGAFAASVSAQPMGRMAEKLGLTEEQQQSLADIRAEFKQSREDVRAQREVLREAAKSGDVETAADMAANDARERVYREAEMRKQVAEILTPEQLEQWDALRESRAEGRKGRGNGERKGRRGGRQPLEVDEGIQG